MRRKEFLQILSGGILTGTLGLPRFAQAETGTGKIRIGFLAALTGFAAAGERIHVEGAELARDWINSQGGIPIAGVPHMIELVIEDHGSSAEGAVTGATRLVYDEGVRYIAGTIMPFTVAAVTTVTEPAGVLRSVGYNAGNPQEFSADTPYTFLSQNGTIGAIISGMRWLKETFPETRTVAALIPDDGAIPHLEVHLRRAAEANGMSLAGPIVGWPLNTVDFRPFALNAAGMAPDAVLMVNGWPGMVGNVLKSLREAGYSRPVLGMHYLQVEDVLEVAGPQASDNYYVHGLMLDDPELPERIRWLLETGRARYRHSTLAFWVEGFDPVYTLAQAIAAAQSLEPDVIRATWEQMETIDTAYGPARMGGQATYGLRHAVVGPRAIAGLEQGRPVGKGWIRDINVP